MSTRTRLSHATEIASGPAPSTARRSGRDDSGIMVSPAEVALLRVNAKPGAEGNELILRSGVIIPLTYAEAVEMRNSLVLVEQLATNTPHLRNAVFELVGSQPL